MNNSNRRRDKFVRKQKRSDRTLQRKRVLSKPYDEKIKEPPKRTLRKAYDPKTEARLERIVFGDPNDIINNLPDDEPVESHEDEKVARRERAIESNVIEIDADDSGARKKPVWEDEDDAQYSVEAAVEAQNRKLVPPKKEKLYTQYLQNKYHELVGTPKWAELNKTDNDLDDLDNEILKHSCHLAQPKAKNLPKNIIDIKALTPINKETHTEGPIVSSIEFHPSSTAALVAGSSGILSLFQVDGVENNKLHTMQYNRFPISQAKFLREGTEVLLGSQFHAHCHSYNLVSGKTYRIPLPHGITNMKKFEVSPDGKLLALCGRLGEIHLLTASTKELVGTLKMNAKCTTMAFTPDSKTLVTHGESNEMYIWDVNSRACVNRAIDNGCLCCASIAISPSGQFLATGSKEGVVNLYDTKTIVQNRIPTPLKIVLNLVTSITALKFNPHSEILAMASEKKNNAFKMLHLPSFSVFSNFPTFQTNMSMPLAIDFSPGSGYLGISNRSGSAFLYRLKHYGNY